MSNFKLFYQTTADESFIKKLYAHFTLLNFDFLETPVSDHFYLKNILAKIIHASLSTVLKKILILESFLLQHLFKFTSL